MSKDFGWRLRCLGQVVNQEARARRHLYPRMAQVISCTGTERYSTAFFMMTNYDCVVDPAHLPACCLPGKPPAWQPITGGQYLLEKLNLTHAIFRNRPDLEPVH